MSILLGVIKKSEKGPDIDQKWLPLMHEASELWPRDREFFLHENHYAFSLLQFYNTPQSPLSSPPFSNNIYILFDGRLDNREDLAKSVNLPYSDNLTDEELILATYHAFGTRLGEHLVGDFAIAIYDVLLKKLFLVRDPFGVRPLFFSENPHYFAFSSNKASLLALPWVSSQLNEQWIADYLAMVKVDVDATPYQRIRSFTPAHSLTIENGVSEHRRYWSLPDAIDFDFRSNEETLSEFRKLLERSIQCRTRCFGGVAAELSGGLDSTTIAAVAAKHLKEKSVTVLSYVLPPESIEAIFPYKDESHLVEQLVADYPNMHYFPIYNDQLNHMGAMERAIRVHSGPPRNDFTLYGSELFEKMKAVNSRCLLSGFGGDHLVSSAGDGWDWDLIQSKQFIRLYSEHRLLASSRPRALKNLYHSVRAYCSRRWFNHAQLKQADWERYLEERILDPAFLQQQGYPERFFSNPVRQNHGSLKSRERSALLAPQVVYRMEDSAVGAAAFGAEYRYPLMDIRLLTFCHHLPWYYKISEGKKRKIIRMATEGLLPDSIRLRHNKTFAANPTVFRNANELKTHLLRCLRDDNQATELNKYLSTEDVIEQLSVSNMTDPQTQLKMNKTFFLRLGAFILWHGEHNICTI